MNWIKPDWPAASNIHAATTLRAGGLSKGHFSSLNPALHVNDNAERVMANRENITAMLNLPSSPVWLNQTHSDRVIKADDNIACVAEADASYTDQSNIVCAIMTADCLPILLTNLEGSKVAAIHAGWRGLLAGIVSRTVASFNSQHIMAWLGPAIGPECFEIGPEVEAAFIKKSTVYSVAFTPHNKKFFADIYQLARIELASIGITEIYGGGFCTMTDEQRFYSYRRDGETGRMASLIWRN